MKPSEAAKRIKAFDAALPRVIVGVLDEVGQQAHLLAVTKFMQGLGSGANAQPPNAPPGPLGIRSGDLRRAYGRMKPAKLGADKWAIGLTIDLNKAPYGLIHEYGGTINHPGSQPVKASVLAWKAKGTNAWVFAMKTKPHKIHIPARPVATPAMLMAAKDAPQRLDAAISALGIAVLEH